MNEWMACNRFYRAPPEINLICRSNLNLARIDFSEEGFEFSEEGLPQKMDHWMNDERFGDKRWKTNALFSEKKNVASEAFKFHDTRTDIKTFKFVNVRSCN